VERKKGQRYSNEFRRQPVERMNAAATLLGSQKSSQCAAGYFATGATECTRPILPLYGPAN
jgi:hypothetical protein